MRFFVRRPGCLLIACLMAAQALAQGPASGIQRTFPYSLDRVKQSLERLGAYAGGKLPMLDGFVSSEAGQMERYERPYYQYRIDLKPIDANHTAITVEAKISAWFTDTDSSRSGYRAVSSNGHLESDLLDRLQEALNPKAADPGAEPKSSRVSGSRDLLTKAPASSKTEAIPASSAQQRKLDELRAEKLAVDQKTLELESHIHELEEASQRQTTTGQFASVKHTGAGVMSQMNYGGPVLFRARGEDEFEVVKKEGEWVQVRLGPDVTGWIAGEELNLPETKAETSANPAGPAGSSELGFWVSREQVNEFSGEWSQLKGKKALFVFAQSRGMLPELANDNRKLVYAKQIFADRYRTASLTQYPFDGVVVIFVGGKGGVAAATMKDIRQWVLGSLGDGDFVKRCSLDPRGEFEVMQKP